MQNYNYLLTSSLWLEALVKKEVQKQDYTITQVQDKAVYFEWWVEGIARMNLWSRCGNILYLVLEKQKNITDFNTYFNTLYSIEWKKYIPDEYEILVKATSIKSDLWSLSSLQSLAKKAIVKKLVGENTLKEDSSRGMIEVRVLMENNTLKVLLNTSWDWLHKRGYREMAWDAPLKENLAAALVMLSGWRYTQVLYDPFCGSGTIVIESAMIARNMAPWLKRSFAFENWEWIDSDIITEEKKRAKSLQYDGDYTIYASDIDVGVIEKARRNAKFAWVDSDINFSPQDYELVLSQPIQWTLISNPPYGKRLDAEIDQIHTDIASLLSHGNMTGGIITSYPNFEGIIPEVKYKKRKLYNGWELCYFYRKVEM